MNSHWHDNPFWIWLKKYWRGLIGLGIGFILYGLASIVVLSIVGGLYFLLTGSFPDSWT